MGPLEKVMSHIGEKTLYAAKKAKEFPKTASAIAGGVGGYLLGRKNPEDMDYEELLRALSKKQGGC